MSDVQIKQEPRRRAHETYQLDIAECPHLLIARQTGEEICRRLAQSSPETPEEVRRDILDTSAHVRTLELA